MSENFTEDCSKPLTTATSKPLQRRSSIQKILHMCNQSYQVFPYVFLWFQGFQTSIHLDLRKVISLLKSVVALRLGIYLSIALLSVELLYCIVVTFTFFVSYGLVFFLFCVGILSVMAFQIFDVAVGVRKNFRRYFSVKKKIL